MKLTFLGTAAAEGIPAIWCTCETCKKAWERKGKDLRHRTAYLLDDDTVIDWGPDLFSQSLTYGIDLLKIARVIITHPHEDHLTPMEFVWRLDNNGYSQVSENIDLVASKPCMDYLEKRIDLSLEHLRVIPKEATAGQWVSSGDVEILPIPAAHASSTGALLYVIRRRGKNLLIGHDTGWLEDTAWEILRGVPLDAIVLECTCGLRHPDYQINHLGMNGTVRFRDKLNELGCISSATQQYVTHFSHNGHATHDDFVSAFKPHGITVAYDGLVAEI